MKILLFLSISLTVSLIGLASSATTKPTTTPVPSKSSTSSTSTSPKSSTTTKSAEEVCKAASGGDCPPCLKNAQCLYCYDDKSCIKYPVGNILPMKSCKGGLDAARWGVCWVNFKTLLIVMGVLAAVILLSLGCCIYCCCCRSGGNKKKYQEQEAKWARQREERQAKSEERRAERKVKHDEIRRKYGLIKEDNPYQRFDDK